MGKPLRPDLIIQRSKSDRLDMVKSLNLWGNDIEDVSILRELPNVEILSLSVNQITTLEDFSHCGKLSELYLRKNLISDLAEVQYLRGLRNLRVLWLQDNPCSDERNYRAYVISILPQLTKLDN
jgi:Leucine-rich repeat (LRR) protein